MTNRFLPRASATLTNAAGPPTAEWRRFFESLAAQTDNAALQAELLALAARVSELEDDPGADIGLVLGQQSIQQVGVLTSGNVYLMLQGDAESPGNSYYYGTDALGVKGWHALSLGALSDVDLTTVPPTSGDALVFDGADWVPGAVLSNPMTTLGDIITADTGGVPQRLPVGADGDVLTVVAGEAAWVAGGGGGGPRGITVTGGSIGGSVITAAQVIGGLSASDYTLTGNWYLWCSPTGSIELDVRAAAFGSLPPGPGDSICGGNEPAVVADISATGNFTGWTTGINQNDALSVVVNSVTDVTWFVLLLEAT